MNSRKVVLISTYPDIQAYGIRILSSILKVRGFLTSLVFLNAPFGSLYSKEVLAQVAELSEGSAFVGISLMTNFFERAKQATLFLKECLKIPVVWGGIHTAIRPDECLDYADAICIGEAEDIIIPVAEGLSSYEGMGEAHNVWFKKNSGVVKNRIAPLIDDISRLPLPDYEYRDHFIIDGNKLVAMNSALMEEYMGYEYSTMATRGCFYNCTFCANNFFDKNFGTTKTMRIRSRDMRDIVDELIWAKKYLSFIRIFKLVDDLFMALPKETIEEFCGLYKASGLGMPLNITGIHPLVIKEDKFKLLVDAGLEHARMGIQSGSQNIRRLYGRGESEGKIMEGVQIIHKYKNRLKSISYDFMVDNPWEKPEDIKDSLRLLARIPKPYRINQFSLTLYPGTELYDKAKKEGLILDEGSQIFNKHYHDDMNASYYNGLFKIISAYRLPKRVFIFMINNEESLMARALYFILIHGAGFAIGLKRLSHLLKEGASDMINGDFSRVNKFIFMRTKVVH